ncbi:MAG: enoyl-CoA hydratase/isomerase family protein [Alphaproteobacteria bacterium]
MTRATVLEEDPSPGVRLLTMNRPEKRNAFDHRLYCDLRDALRDARDDDRVHVVVLTGAGKGFSAGQDFAEMSAPPDGEPHGFPTFLDALCEFDKPLLAAVNGAGSGLGLTMLLHCDVVHVGESARLRCPFVTLGVVPEAASSFLLPLVVGFQRAAEILYSADWIDSERAVELGLAHRRLPDALLLPETLAKAAAIAAHPPRAVRQTKQLLLATRAEAVRAARAREDAAFTERIGSPENVEAITAFFEKRAPDFSRTR